MCGVKIILILQQRPLQRFTRLLPKRFFLSTMIFERTKATYFIKLGGGGGGVILQSRTLVLISSLVTYNLSRILRLFSFYMYLYFLATSQ